MFLLKGKKENNISSTPSQIKPRLFHNIKEIATIKLMGRSLTCTFNKGVENMSEKLQVISLIIKESTRYSNRFPPVSFVIKVLKKCFRWSDMHYLKALNMFHYFV